MHRIDPIRHIPFGLASKLMTLVAAGAYAVAAITAIVEGDKSQETITAAILGTSALITLALGRYAQAALDRLSWYFDEGRDEEATIGGPTDLGPSTNV